jgi:hypothetical protein
LFFAIIVLSTTQIASGDFSLEPPALNVPEYPFRNKKLFILNEGNDPIIWSASADQNWLTLYPTSGTVTGAYQYIKVRVTRKGLPAGEHFAEIKITTDKGVQTVPVSLSINSAVLPEIAMDYVVTIDQPETHYAHVKTVFSCMDWLDWVRLSSHTFELEDTWLENMNVYDQNGTTLDFDLNIENDSLRWRRLTIQNPERSPTITVEYDTHFLNHDSNSPDAYQAGIMEERALFDPAHIFFCPDRTPYGNFGVPHDDVTFTFAGQADWKVATPWLGSGSTFNIVEMDLFYTIFSYGNYDISVLDLNGLMVRIAIPPGALNYTSLASEKIIQEIQRALLVFQGIYGNPSRSGAEADDILCVIVTYPLMNSHDSSLGSVCLDITDFHYQLTGAAGNLFEYWQFCDPSGKGWSSTLFPYGFYKNYKLLGYMSESHFMSELEQLYTVYINDVYETQYDVPVPELIDKLYYSNANSLTDEERIGYTMAYESKVALIWHMIDKRIQKKTRNQKDLYDFLVYMSQNHATSCPDGSAIDALSTVSCCDFTPFFNNYYYGTKKLDDINSSDSSHRMPWIPLLLLEE